VQGKHAITKIFNSYPSFR